MITDAEIIELLKLELEETRRDLAVARDEIEWLRKTYVRRAPSQRPQRGTQ